MIDKWIETGERTLITTRIFELRERRSINPRNGQEIPFFVLESNDWVNVIPLTEEGKVIMVRQYRQGTRTVTLEIPGGVVEAGESPLEGGRRELLEETGYAADQLEELGLVHSNPAIQDNATYTFLATGLKRVAELDPDQAEDLEVVEVELAEVDELIRKGAITHSLVVAAFYWLRLHQNHLERLERVLDQMAQAQLDKVGALAKRVNSRLTPEDLRNPQDFPELAADPDFNYQDGLLAGIESARAAMRGLRRGGVLQ
jgi:8-oxo-dGTP pyrophosphatase MutT (NUDIX family)